MAIVTTTVNRLGAVSDLFESFFGASNVCSKLKDKHYPEESIFQFLQLTANDDLEARALVLKDLGFTEVRIERLNELLAEGKILISVDGLDERGCGLVEKIFNEEGALGLESYFTQARVPVKKKAVRRPRKRPSSKPKGS